jgi:hypothetical protein
MTPSDISDIPVQKTPVFDADTPLWNPTPDEIENLVPPEAIPQTPEN